LKRVKENQKMEREFFKGKEAMSSKKPQLEREEKYFNQH
jgi:hypothetical protein